MTQDSKPPVITDSSVDARRGNFFFLPFGRQAVPPGADGGNGQPGFPFHGPLNVTATVAPPLVASPIKVVLVAALALYILNQKHLLPRPLSAIVSKVFFWPTLPITFGRRYNTWTTKIDDTVVMGGAPFSFIGVPEMLHEQYRVRGVVNMCEEYNGPVKRYDQLGITELYLPTTDHFEPEVSSLETAVDFIKQHEKEGNRVYVHCRAGHGRSAAIVFAWLLSKDPSVDRKELNNQFRELRHVRKTLWKQPNIVKYHAKLLKGIKGN